MNTCLLCEKSSDEIPVIAFKYKGQGYHVCTAHLPALLHEPEKFADKIADAGKDWTAEHHHD